MRGMRPGTAGRQRLERRARGLELGPVVVGVVQRRGDVGAQGVDHDPEHVVRAGGLDRPPGSTGLPQSASGAPPVAEGSETVRRTSSIGWAPHAERFDVDLVPEVSVVRRHVGLGNRVRRARGVDDGDLEVRGRSRRRGQGRGRAQAGPGGQRHAKGQRRRRRSEDRLALVVAALVHVPHARLGRPGAAVSAGDRPLGLFFARAQRNRGHQRRSDPRWPRPGTPHLSPVALEGGLRRREVRDVDVRLAQRVDQVGLHLVRLGPARFDARARSRIRAGRCRRCRRRHARVRPAPHPPGQDRCGEPQKRQPEDREPQVSPRWPGSGRAPRKGRVRRVRWPLASASSSPLPSSAWSGPRRPCRRRPDGSCSRA